jgi:uncharacterized membrane protein (DUF373 family)
MSEMRRTIRGAMSARPDDKAYGSKLARGLLRERVVPLMRMVGKFESLINVVLLALIAVVVLLTVFQLGVQIVTVIANRPLLQFELNELLDILGNILLVLIGVELMHTVKIYLIDKSVHVEVILAVGLVAITRKVVLLDHSHVDGISLIGISAIILSLSVSYYLVRQSHQQSRAID